LNINNLQNKIDKEPYPDSLIQSYKKECGALFASILFEKIISSKPGTLIWKIGCENGNHIPENIRNYLREERWLPS